MSKPTMIVFGAHPDDPESGCGGLILNAVAAGWDVVCLYGTTLKGSEFRGRPIGEVRADEAHSACGILGARVEFLPYEDRYLEVNAETRRHIGERIAAFEPDVVVAHWPIDTHADHRAAGVLALDAYLAHRDARRRPYAFYFLEVMTGRQSLRFMPTHYVDITAVADRKRAALLCHESQEPASIWEDHEIMHRFRGRECAVDRAEAYIRVDRGPDGILPGSVGLLA